jgi:hypothetical protein
LCLLSDFLFHVLTPIFPQTRLFLTVFKDVQEHPVLKANKNYFFYISAFRILCLLLFGKVFSENNLCTLSLLFCLLLTPVLPGVNRVVSQLLLNSTLSNHHIPCPVAFQSSSSQESQCYLLSFGS